MTELIWHLLSVGKIEDWLFEKSKAAPVAKVFIYPIRGASQLHLQMAFLFRMD